MDEEDDDSKVLQPHAATIVHSTKQKINNNDEIPEKSLGLRTKSILTQVSNGEEWFIKKKKKIDAASPLKKVKTNKRSTNAPHLIAFSYQ